jgi:TRAP-type C4-dicarboxylate transport system permease small subunit
MGMNTGKEEVQAAAVSGFTRFVAGLTRVTDPLGRIAAGIAATMLAVMMFLTFFDVAGGQLGKLPLINTRTTFFKPIIGGQEIAEFLMLMLVCFGLAYCALRKGHIRVDLIMQYTSQKVNLWFNILAYGVASIFYAVVTWQCWISAWGYLLDHSSSPILYVPLFPFAFILVIGLALLTLVFLRDFLSSIDEATRCWNR